MSAWTHPAPTASPETSRPALSPRGQPRSHQEAYLTIAFAALALARWLETTTGGSIKTLVNTLRRHRTIDIQAGDTIVTAETALPNDAQAWLDAVHHAHGRHQMSQVG